MNALLQPVPNAHRIGIGTVQFGTNYGITNLHGQVPRGTVAEILRVARQAGIRLLDTAAMYGESEEVLGQLVPKGSDFQITTKTTTSAIGVEGVVERARESHRILGGHQIHGLLVHSASDLRSSNGPELWAALRTMRDEGLFSRLGISAYGSDNPIELARRYRPDIIQMPVSVLDQRPARTGVIKALKDLGVEVHARSVFLQGAIFLKPSDLPLGLAHMRPRLETFHVRLAEFGLTPVQAGIGYPLSIPEIDCAVVGISSVEETRGILDAAANAPVDMPWEDLAVDDEVLLDPRLWVSNQEFRVSRSATKPSRPTVIAILQARMSSSRLPGKVLRPIMGRPMLGRHLDRLKRCRMIDRLVVATSVEKSDDEVAAFCAAEGISCYRGPLHDVLARYEGAARENDPIDHVVRLTGDCPLADPEVIDEVIRTHLAGDYDYSANIIEPRYPNGLDTEIMTRAALRLMATEASSPYEREHVTPFLYTRPTRFKLGSLQNKVDQSHMRWTVDTEDDFRMVDAVYRELLPVNERFTSDDIVALLQRRPDIAAINRRVAH
jgi:spore coat polysaccharide biosynthesis protein SpsF